VEQPAGLGQTAYVFMMLFISIPVHFHPLHPSTMKLSHKNFDSSSAPDIQYRNGAMVNSITTRRYSTRALPLPAIMVYQCLVVVGHKGDDDNENS
jgi:hypothetical protein